MSAESGQSPENSEQYALSLTHYRLGHLACGEAIKFDASMWPAGMRDQAYTDLESSVGEAIQTDEDFIDHVSIGRITVLRVIDNIPCTSTGESILAISAKGIAAAPNPIQLQRDQDHHANNTVFASLRVGELAHAVSVDPRQQLLAEVNTDDTNLRPFHNLGYRIGVAYDLGAYRASDDELMLFSTYVNSSNLSTLRQVLHEHGADIPQDYDYNRWGSVLMRGVASTIDDAREQMTSLARRQDQLTGRHTKRFSVEEYLEANRDLMESYFNMYGEALAAAVTTGRNQEALKSLAARLLPNLPDTQNVTAQARQQIMRVANSERFDDDSGRAMLDLIRYAIIEDMRGGLQALVAGEYATPTEAREYYDDRRTSDGVWQVVDVNMMSEFMARQISNGLEAGRAPGGCAFSQLGLGQAYANMQSQEEEAASDWHGGEIIKNSIFKEAVCQVCEKVVQEMGGCSICRSCTKNKAKRDAAWNRHQLAQVKQRWEARESRSDQATDQKASLLDKSLELIHLPRAA